MPHNHGVAPWSGKFYSSAHSLPSDVVTMKNNTVETSVGVWGIVLKPTLRYRVVFDRPFHLKQAVLDFSGFIKQDFHFRVMLLDNKDDRSPLTLCILNKENALQTSLDLEFDEGDDVTFYVKTDLYNMDLNSFSVSLSGKSTRDPETFVGPKKVPRSTEELIVKLRSSSLPDEAFRPKKPTPSPLTKSPPPTPSPLTKSPPPTPGPTPAQESADGRHSSSASLLRAESVHEERNNSDQAADKPQKSQKGSFRGKAVFGKIGKLLSK